MGAIKYQHDKKYRRRHEHLCYVFWLMVVLAAIGDIMIAQYVRLFRW